MKEIYFSWLNNTNKRVRKIFIAGEKSYHDGEIPSWTRKLITELISFMALLQVDSIWKKHFK